MNRKTFEKLKSMGIAFDDDFEQLMVVPTERMREEVKKDEEFFEEKQKEHFLPVVLINQSEEPKNSIITLDECDNFKLEKLSLGNDYDKEYQNYSIANITIAKNSISRIPLKVKRGFDPWGFQNDIGELIFSTSGVSAKLDYINFKHTDYDDNSKKYDIKKTENSDVFVLEINAKALDRGTKFSITIHAKASGKYKGKLSERNSVCGKFNVKVVEKDVFMLEEFLKAVAINKTLVHVDKVCFRVADKQVAGLLNDNK